MNAPEMIPVKRMEDLYTNYVGVSEQSQCQYWYVEWPRSISDKTGISAVLFTFEPDGRFRGSHAIHVAECSDTSTDVVSLLASLGQTVPCDIAIRPFSIVLNDVQFGLFLSDDTTIATLEPGSLLMFSSPWDGEYWT